MTAGNGYTARYAPLLFGSTCRIEETKSGGATSTVITNDGEEVSEFTVDSLTDVDVPGGAGRTLAEGRDFTATYDDLPVGAECTLVETDDGGAPSTTITPNDGDPEVGTVTVVDGASVKREVANEYPALGPAGATEDEGRGLLPDTGAGRALRILLVLGLVLLSAGVGLIAGSRRRRHS